MISNNPSLETTNINRYILPGTLKPLARKPYGNGTLKGDKTFLHRLAGVVNDSENFDMFSAGGTTTKKRIIDTGEKREVIKKLGKMKYKEVVKKKGEWTWNGIVPEYSPGVKVMEFDGWDPITVEEAILEEIEVTVSNPSERGYLRNMLINTELIKQAFGVDDSKGFTVESVSILEAVETLFSLINQDISFWNFQLTVDPLHTYRVKIIDDQVTGFDFRRTVAEQTTGGETKKPAFDKNGKIVNHGVFFFPAWKNDSIVKRQNITAKIPNAMALTAMYGANMDQLKEFNNPGGAFGDKEKESMGAAGLWNDVADRKLEGLNIAFRNTPEIGTATSRAAEPLKVNGGSIDNILDFLNRKDIQKKIQTGYKTRLDQIDEALNTSQEVKDWNEKYPNYDDSVPPPLPENLTTSELSQILEDENNEWGQGTLEELFNSKFLPTGEIKPLFMNSIKFLTVEHGVLKKSNQPLMIPLDLELDIDGTGGIYPGNSFHSTYLPKRYQQKTVFQMFEVNHTVDSTGWTTSITGKMRATMDTIYDRWKTGSEIQTQMFKATVAKAKVDEEIRTKNTEKKIEETKKSLNALTDNKYVQALSPPPIGLLGKVVNYWTKKK